MTKYGSAFSATDTLARAPGSSQNAQVTAFANVFDLAVDGGTSEALKCATLPPGFVPLRMTIDSGANLSGINFKLGTPTDDDAYLAAVAGPNATVQERHILLALGVTPLDEAVDALLTPSGNLPGAGTIRVVIYGTQR